MSSPEERRERVNVLGVGVSVLNLDSALAAVQGALEKKTKGYVCVTGVHGVMEAQNDAIFRGILNQAFLNTPDGMPMVWVGKWRGHRQMDRVYGPDLMFLICDFTRRTGFTHFLYGGAPGVAEELKSRLEKKFPGLKIVGTYTPPFRPLNAEEEKELVGTVSALKPDIVWVGGGETDIRGNTAPGDGVCPRTRVSSISSIARSVMPLFLLRHQHDLHERVGRQIRLRGLLHRCGVEAAIVIRDVP